MKKFFLIFIALFSHISGAYSKNIPITLTAQKVFGNPDKQITATNGTLKYGNSTLSAYLIIFDTINETITAVGDVFLEDGNSALFCSRLKYNLKTKKAELLNAKGKLSQSDFIKAEKLIRVSDSLWIAYNGIYTPCCNCCEYPDWSIEAKEFKIQSGKSFKGKWVSFDILSVPVIISPVISGPIVEKRTTGFIFPKFGYIKDQGFTIKQPFYLVLGRSSDATFYYEKRFNNGSAKGLDLRYIISPYSEGNISYNRIDTDEKGEWNSRLNHSYIKSDYSYGHLKINIISSKNFYTENGTTDVETLTSQYTKSDITYSKLWNHAILNTNLVFLYNLDGSRDTIFQKLPEINFYLMDIPLYKNYPVTFNLDSSLTYFYRKTGYRGARLNIKPAARYSFFFKNIKNSFKISNLFTEYFISDNGTNFINRNLWMYEENHFTNLSIKTGNFRASISPELSFQFTEKKTQNNIPEFDGTDKVEEEKKIKGSIDISFYNNEKRIAKFNISNSYNFYLDNTPWEPWKLELELFSDERPLTLREYTEINHTTGKIEKINSRIDTRIKKLTIWANHYKAFTDETNNYLRWGGDIKLNRYLSFSYSQRYDFLNHLDRERTYSLSINRNCWNGNLTYHWIKNYDGKTTYQITLTVNLLKLGGYQYKYEGERTGGS